ncbi:hypothetical protein J4Q44_G00229790 [Coregonus suidteri]|uniref:Uncharacterized protein n=1 Tax=Coregonus suidteri TaxID=861788 RepID=A0AAN8L5P7_9TELE
MPQWHPALITMLCEVLGLVHSNTCTHDVQIYICQEIPQSYPAGLSSLVLFVSNVGEINATVFHSYNLGSVTHLTINNAGITGIPSGALRSFHNLNTFRLDLNSLSQLSPAWFSQPATLQNLTLIQNPIEVVEEGTFRRFTGPPPTLPLLHKDQNGWEPLGLLLSECVVCTLAVVWRTKREAKQVKASREGVEEEGQGSTEQTDRSTITLHREVDSVMSNWDPELATKTH